MNPHDPSLGDQGEEDHSSEPTSGSGPNAAHSMTVGTGSALGIGCVVAVVVFVVFALALRWLTGIW